MISTIIVDDSKSSIDVLCNDLIRYPCIKVTATATSVERAKTVILRHQPALLFLDVEMPDQSGLALLREISSYIHPCMCVVFYSAFGKYAIEAMRAAAFDFLLKPYQPEELDLIIHRVQGKIASGQINFEPSKLHFLNAGKKLGIYTNSGTALLLSKAEILYFEYSSESRYWFIKLANFTEHKLQSSTTSRKILEIHDSFAQINRECILNLDYLSSINSKYECSLYPPFQNIQIKASRRCYIQLKNRLDFL